MIVHGKRRSRAYSDKTLDTYRSPPGSTRHVVELLWRLGATAVKVAVTHTEMRKRLYGGAVPPGSRQEQDQSFGLGSCLAHHQWPFVYKTVVRH